MLNCFVVGMGGFIGSVARYLIGQIPLRAAAGFPVNTLLINVAGAFLIGIIAAAALKNQQMNPKLVLFLKVGICGGFTTFSTFSMETADLLNAGSFVYAGAYVILSVVLCVTAVFAVQIIMR